MKVSVLIPTANIVDEKCLISAQNQDYLNYDIIINVKKPEGPHVGQAKISYNSTLNRNELRDHALNRSSDYFLFLDSDTIIPRNTITEFIKQKHFDIIGGWCKMVEVPYWVAGKEVAKNNFYLALNPTPSISKFDIIGLGCIFISRKALESIEFQDGINESAIVMGKGVFLGPSAKFSQIARSKGFNLYMNGDVVCKHLVRNKV